MIEARSPPATSARIPAAFIALTTSEQKGSTASFTGMSRTCTGASHSGKAPAGGQHEGGGRGRGGGRGVGGLSLRP